jgi:hypothetical protein
VSLDGHGWLLSWGWHWRGCLVGGRGSGLISVLVAGSSASTLLAVTALLNFRCGSWGRLFDLGRGLLNRGRHRHRLVGWGSGRGDWLIAVFVVRGSGRSWSSGSIVVFSRDRGRWRVVVFCRGSCGCMLASLSCFACHHGIPFPDCKEKCHKMSRSNEVKAINY